MSEIRPVGRRTGMAGGDGAGTTPGSGLGSGGEPGRGRGAGDTVTGAPMRGVVSAVDGVSRPGYGEIAELRQLQSRLDRQHVGARVPPVGDLRRDLGVAGRPDPTLPHPSPIPGDNLPMDLSRIHGILRAFLEEQPGAGDGPRSEMSAVLRSWCSARERIAHRLGARG